MRPSIATGAIVSLAQCWIVRDGGSGSWFWFLGIFFAESQNFGVKELKIPIQINSSHAFMHLLNKVKLFSTYNRFMILHRLIYPPWLPINFSCINAVLHSVIGHRPQKHKRELEKDGFPWIQFQRNHKVGINPETCMSWWQKTTTEQQKHETPPPPPTSVKKD